MDALPLLLTGIRRADVYKMPSANAGPDQAVCGPKVTLTATPSMEQASGITLLQLWYQPLMVRQSELQLIPPLPGVVFLINFTGKRPTGIAKIKIQ